METKQYLTFRFHELQYGIEAALVQEIFPLPELTPVAEAIADIVGFLNLRGQIVPMMHLDLLQGLPVKGCNLDDHIIVMQWEGLQFGIVVHQVNEVLELNADAIKTEQDDQLICDINTAFIAGVAKVEACNIVLIEPKTLISQLDAILPLIWDAQMQLDGTATSPSYEIGLQREQDGSQLGDELPSLKFYDLYCPNATLEERAMFRQRADTLKQSVESTKVTSELIHLAVVSLGNEYFGLELELVKEFTDISNLTPIPCCPNHIVGNMNLRGEIVTLVDIRNALDLPISPVRVGSQVVVVQVDDIVAGLPVDRVFEMVYLNSADLTPQSAIPFDLGGQYLRGTTLFQEKKLKVLDLPKIFIQGELAVNEQA